MMGVSLFFSETIEQNLKLKPDMSGVSDSAFEVHFIDVGQGDAIAIRFPNDQTMLVDSGPTKGKDNLEEYLNKVFFEDSDRVFDYVFLTHSDVDHSGNMNFIVENYEVKNFYRPKIYSENLEDDKTGFKIKHKTYDTILTTLDRLDIDTYYPTNDTVINCGESQIKIITSLQELDNTNDFSPILIVSSLGNKVCLSGDTSDKIEEELVARDCLEDVDLFKLAHHGSKYGNTEGFLAEIQPEYVVCCVGENSYGHPSSEALLNLTNYDDAYNKTTFDTFKTTLKNGNIIYYVNTNEFECTTIENLGDYLFVDWYIIVIAVDASLVLYILLYIIPKKPIKLNKHLKNMKK